MAKHHFSTRKEASEFTKQNNGFGRIHDNRSTSSREDRAFTVRVPEYKWDSGNEGSDFDSDLNGNGTNWHTSEDL